MARDRELASEAYEEARVRPPTSMEAPCWALDAALARWSASAVRAALGEAVREAAAMRPKRRSRRAGSREGFGREATTKPQRSSPKPSAPAESGSHTSQKKRRAVSSIPCAVVSVRQQPAHAPSRRSTRSCSEGGVWIQTDQSSRHVFHASAAYLWMGAGAVNGRCE